MGKQQKGLPNSLTPADLEVIKYRQENPQLYKAHIMGLAGSYADTGIDYKAMGYGKAAGGYQSSWWKPGDTDRAEWATWNPSQDIALKAFEQQSIGELVGDTIVGGVKRFAAGFIDSIGAWDVSNMTAMAMNKTDVDYSNVFNRLGKKISNDANEKNQIYQDPNESIWNMPYFANQVQQLGYTGGIIAEMIAENIALDWATGGAQNIASIPTKLKMLSTLGKDAAFGMVQGVKEAHMNALETQNNVFTRYKELGYSDDEALIKSREAANIHFKTESGALAVMNGLQNMMFLGSLSRATGRGVKNVFKPGEGFKMGFSDAFQTVGEKAFGAVTNKITNKTLQKGINKTIGNAVLAGSEAVEEGIQTGIGQYSEDTVMGKKFDIGDALASNEMRDSMIGGAMGGLLLGAGFKAVSKFRNKEFDTNFKDFIGNTINRSSEAYEASVIANKQLEDAQTNYSNNPRDVGSFIKLKKAYAVAETAKDNMHAATVISSLQFDYGKKSGSTVAFDMYVKHLHDTLEAAKNGDTETLKNHNIIDAKTGKEKFEGVLEDIKNTFENKIEDAYKMKELYENELANTTSDFRAATDIVTKKYQAYKNERIIDENTQKISELSEGLSQLGLSPQGVRRAHLLSEMRALQANPEIKNSEYGKARLAEITAEYENLENYSTEDKRVLRRNGYNPGTGIRAMEEIYTTNHELVGINDELYNEANKESKPEEIERKILEARKKKIKKAKTKEEVEAITQETKQELGAVPTNLAEEAAKKAEELALQESLSEQERIKAQTLAEQAKKSTPTGAINTDEVNDILGEIDDVDESLGEVDSLDDILSQYNEKAIDGVFNSRQGENKIGKFIENLNKFYQRKEGRDATLNDMIHEFAALGGLENVRSKFNNLVKALGENGVDISDAKNIYNTFFTLPKEILEDITEDQAGTTNNAVVSKAVNDSAPKKMDVNGEITVQPFDFNSGRTSNPDLKAAHNYLASTRDSLDNWVVTSDSLQANPLVGNLYSLDPNYLQELYSSNKELEVRPVDDPTAKMSYINIAGETITTTWEEVKARIGDNPERLYNAIPMVVYDGDTPLFTVHNTTWYNEFNVQGNEQMTSTEVIEQGIKNVTDLRQKVREGKNKVRISTFRVGNVDRLNEHINSAPRPIAEAAGPDSHIAVYSKTAHTSDWRVSKDTPLAEVLKDAIVLGENSKNRVPGTILEFRKFGVDPNTKKDIYIALEVMNHSPLATGAMQNNLSQQIFNNIKYVTLANVLLENKGNTTLEEAIKNEFNFTPFEAEALQKEILKSTKIDIATNAREYVNMFVASTDLNGRKHEQLTYFENKDYPTKNGRVEGIEFSSGTVKTSVIGKVSKGFEKTIVKDLVTFLKDTDGQEALLRKAKYSVNLRSMNREFVNINNEGRIEDTTPVKFSDFAKQNLYTNILSHEITNKDGESIWVTDIQPMIYFTSILSQDTPKSSEIDINDSIKTSSLSEKKKFQTSKKRADLEGGEYKEISIDDIDLEKSNLDGIEDITKIVVLEQRGLNQDGIPVGTVKFYTKNGNETFEVFFKQDHNTNTDINYSLDHQYTKLNETIKSQLLEAGLSKEDIQTMIATGALESMGVSTDTTYESRLVVPDATGRKFDAISTNKISSLTEEEHRELVQSLKNIISSKLDFTKKVTLKSISDNIKTVVEDTIGTIIKDTESRITNLSKLPALADIVENQKAYLEKMKTILREQDNLIRFEKIEDLDGNILEVGDVVKEFTRLFSTRIEDIEDIDSAENSSQEQSERDSENYSKAAYEISALDSLKPDIKLILLGIPLRKVGTSEMQLNTLGLPKYNSLDLALDKLREATTSIKSDWGILMDVLESKYKTTKNPLYSQIKDKLKNTENHIQNEILNKLVQNPTSFDGAMISNETARDSQGNTLTTKVTVTIINESNSKETINIRKILHRDFYLNQLGNLGYVETNSVGQKVLNLEYTKKRLQELQDLRTEVAGGKILTDKEYREVFDKYGFARISDNTVKAFVEADKVFSEKRLFDFIEKQLQRLVTQEEQLRAENDNLNMELQENSLFDLASSQVLNLVKKEVELNGSAVARSTRIGDKTLQGTSNTTMIQDILNDLKEENSTKMDLLSKTQLGKDNFILKLIAQNPDFTKNTNLSWFSPRAIKLHGRDSFGNSDITSLGELDYRSTLFAMYANTNGRTKVEQSLFPGLNFRMSRMTPTTFADKGNMMLWNTAVLDLQRGQLTFDENGNIQLNPIVADFLFEQMFLPEFNRIVESYEMEQNKTSTDIIGYDTASKQFIGFPIFNNITIPIDGKDTLFADAIFNKETGKLAKTDPNSYKEIAIQVIEDWLTYNINTKISPDGKSGKLVDIGMFNPNPIEFTKDSKVDGENVKKKITEVPYKNIQTSFINSKPGETPVDKFRFAMAEYEINTLLNQNNIYSIFLGDQAFYSKDKFIKSQDKGKTYQDTAEAISLVIDKRAAMLIAPGTKFANSEVTGLVSEDNRNLVEYHQVFVNDVEGMSDYIDKYIKTQYGEITPAQQKLIDEIKELNKQIDSIYDQFRDSTTIEEISGLDKEINKLSKQRDNVVSSLQDTAPEIADYFNITGTDAQEYSTWKSHLDALYRKGDLTDTEKAQVKSAYEKLSQGKFDEVSKEEYLVIMQPLKTVYTNLVEYTNPVTGATLARPIYIKSSTLPLLPHVTRNTQLDIVREKLEQIENKKNTMVKMSYQTANKIGATKTNLTMQDFYNKPLEALLKEEVDNNGNITYSGLLEDSMITLPTSGLRIQQETPYKQGKYFDKSQDAHISMGSQFMKVIMGNGMNRLGEVFNTTYFNSELLAAVGIDPNKTKLSGKELESIYTHAYKEYSNLIKEQLFEEFGINPDIPFSSLSKEERFRILSSIAKVLQSEIIGKNYPEYMEDSLKVTEELGEFDLPLFFDANTQKFESLLQAIISNRLISHKLPGNGHISASSEGFQFKKIFDEISSEDREGIVYIDENNTSLAPTFFTDENGKQVLKKSRVLIPSHFSYMKNGVWTEIDWTSNEYSSPIMKDGKIVGRKINMDMIDNELLDMFAFRIPTSSHQSGVIIEIAGFLPKQMGDTLVVPREHTTQLGEDYDIDKRYVYKNNYFVNSSGVIQKIGYNGNPINDTDSKYIKKIKIEKKLKGLENVLIDTYKTVFTSDNTEVQKKIFKPLVTTIADETANIIDKAKKGTNNEDSIYFSNLASDYQFYLMRLGADGKGGIGVHSNGVTMQAQLDRLEDTDKVKVLDKNGDPRILRFGPGDYLVSNGVLGATNADKGKAINSAFDVADQHGENQNVSTDNINKQIMIKRNENSYTMSVYAMMAFRKIYTVPVKVDGKTQHLSYPSLFMSQPILEEYVRLRSVFDSNTGDYVSQRDIDKSVIEDLALKFGFSHAVMTDSYGNIEPLEFLSTTFYERGQDSLDGDSLLNHLTEEQAIKNPMQQAAVLQHFLLLKSEAEAMQKYNGLINLSTSKLGVSNFSNIQRINILNDIVNRNVPELENVANLIGKFELKEYLTKEEIIDLKAQGYIEIGDAYWLPTTLEGTMLINSLHAASNIVETVFPYRSPFIDDTIRDVFANNEKDPNKKSVANLKWKYEIVDSMRNFLITLKHSKMFNNIEEERERLFIDKGTHMSLARIIDTLRINKNGLIVNNELLRDFELTVRMDGLPSIIQHFANSNESYDKNLKNEAYKKLLADDTTVLGEFNEEAYTPRKLALDLFSYAYLADTQNGASNFRNHIYYGLLQEMGMNQGIREIYQNLLQEDQTRVQSLMQTFKTQYFQHYPNRASIMSNVTHTFSDFIHANEEAEKVSGDSFQKFLNKLTTFQLKEKENRQLPEFISIRNSQKSVDNKNKKFTLFRRDGNGVYNMIDILGDTGYNEYNANNKTVQPKSSSIVTNAAEQVKIKDNNLVLNLKYDITQQAVVNNAGFAHLKTVEGIIDSFSKSENMKQQTPEMFKLLNEVKDFIPKDINIVFEVPRGQALGQYQEDTDTIVIHPSVWEMLMNKNIGQPNRAILAATQFRELLMEELVHATTVKEFKKWVDVDDRTTGLIKVKESAPDYVKRLVALYDSVKEEVPYNSNDISTYYSKNIYEFMAGMFVAPDYRARVEEKSPGIVARFLDIIRRFFRGLQAQETGNVLSYKDQMFNDVRSLIKDYSESLQPLTQKDQDTEYQNLINNNPGEKIKPVEIKPSLNNPTEFTNHSGGAKGGDTVWDQIGREFGITNHNHYTVAYYDTLTQREKNQLQEQYIGTVNFLKRGVINENTYAGKLVRRDMIQANNGDAIFGITELVKPSIKGRKGYINKTNYSIPEGGTGYAVARGILLNKPTYVFNQSDSYGNEIGWYVWDNSIKDFIKTDTPTLTNNFTGIGSQEINDLGKQAIKDVYEKTFSKSKEEIKPVSQELINTQNIYSKLGNKTASNNVKIVSVYQQNGVKYAKENNAVFSLRINNSDKHFGNPFSPVQAEINKGLIPVKSTKEAVEKYIDWVINSQEPRAKWIKEQLDLGILRNKDIIYYKELGEPSHATALDYLINNWEKISKTTILTSEQMEEARTQVEKPTEVTTNSNVFELGEVKKGKTVSNLTFVNTMDNKSNTIIKGYKIDVNLPLGLEAYLSTEMQLEDYAPIKSNAIQIVYGDRIIRYPSGFGTRQRDVLEYFKEDLTKRSQDGTFLEVVKKTFNIDNQQPNSKISWARRSENSYEVSSKGDKRFSALYAKLKDGRTIEEAYQLDIKGFREQGNDWRLGKGKAPIRQITKEQSWNEYKNLWRTYLNENPNLKQDLIEKSKGKVLTDMFASTDVSQARALAEILNENNTLDSRQNFTNFAQEAFKCK